MDTFHWPIPHLQKLQFHCPLCPRWSVMSTRTRSFGAIVAILLSSQKCRPVVEAKEEEEEWYKDPREGVHLHGNVLGSGRWTRGHSEQIQERITKILRGNVLFFNYFFTRQFSFFRTREKVLFGNFPLLVCCSVSVSFPHPRVLFFRSIPLRKDVTFTSLLLLFFRFMIPSIVRCE